jgi:hypothetical protein
MTFEPEFLIIAGVIFVLTGSFWLYREGPLFGRLTILQARSTQPNLTRGSAAPRLLAIAPVTVASDTDVASPVPVDGGQLGCLSRIVNSGIATADRAERLHRAAGEQVDGAHYALQNLLDELSAVMTITTASKGRRDTRVTQPRATKLPPLAIAA